LYNPDDNIFLIALRFVQSVKRKKELNRNYCRWRLF